VSKEHDDAKNNPIKIPRTILAGIVKIAPG